MFQSGEKGIVGFTCNPSPPSSSDEEDQMEVEQVKADVKRIRVKREVKCEGPKSVVDIFLEGQRSKSKVDQFYCEYCKAPMNSEEIFRNHLQGKKHKKKMQELSYMASSAVEAPLYTNEYRVKTIGAPMCVATKPVKGDKSSMQETLDKYDESPIIGLGYVSEIRRKGNVEPVYFCRLCAAECQPTTIQSHVIGLRHRMAYINLVDPNMYEMINTIHRRQSQSERAESVAAKYERSDGRGKLMIEMEISDDECNGEGTGGKMQFPQHPPSVVKKLVNQAADLVGTERHREMLYRLATLLCSNDELPTSMYVVIFDMCDKFWPIFFRKRIAGLTPEERREAKKLIDSHKIGEIAELLTFKHSKHRYVSILVEILDRMKQNGRPYLLKRVIKPKFF